MQTAPGTDLDVNGEPLDANATTVATYRAVPDTYVTSAPVPTELTAEMLAWIREVVGYVRPGGRVLEIGSAFDRDARELEASGLQVTCSDVVPEFVAQLRALGYTAIDLDVLADDLGGPWDLVYANAVLLHFTRLQVEGIVAKVRSAMPPDGGVVAFTVLEGEGTRWSDRSMPGQRYFRKWLASEITAVLHEAGFDEVLTSVTSTGWLHVIALS